MVVGSQCTCLTVNMAPSKALTIVVLQTQISISANFVEIAFRLNMQSSCSHPVRYHVQYCWCDLGLPRATSSTCFMNITTFDPIILLRRVILDAIAPCDSTPVLTIVSSIYDSLFHFDTCRFCVLATSRIMFDTS